MRITARAVLLLEPDLGAQGRVVRHACGGEALEESTPYSYSWDYPTLISDEAPDWSLTRLAYPLTGTAWGDYYHLFELRYERA